MSFGVDIFGDSSPTESKAIHPKVKTFEEGKVICKALAEEYAALYKCQAGQADLVQGDDLLGTWVWDEKEMWWEQQAKDEIDEHYETLNSEIDAQLYGK